jgi:glycerol kinase
MTRSTGKAEIIKAAEECIAYQIADIVNAMNEDTALTVNELKADGGPTSDKYLMQFQSDILDIDVSIPDTEELSGMGWHLQQELHQEFMMKKIFSVQLKENPSAPP